MDEISMEFSVIFVLYFEIWGFLGEWDSDRDGGDALLFFGAGGRRRGFTCPRDCYFGNDFISKKGKCRLV
jgi:hypothetical protein